jgi:hypothetical protein
MGHNLSKSSKSPGFQAIYKLSLCEKANEELVKANAGLVNRINDELLPAVKKLDEDKETLRRLCIATLFELGGSIELSEEAFNTICGDVAIKLNPITQSATFSIIDRLEEVELLAGVDHDGEKVSEAI